MDNRHALTAFFGRGVGDFGDERVVGHALVDGLPQRACPLAVNDAGERQAGQVGGVIEMIAAGVYARKMSRTGS